MRYPWFRGRVATVSMLIVSCGWPLRLAAQLLSATPIPPNLTIRAEIDGRDIEGRPLFWSKQEVQLLGRDGRLFTFRPSEVDRFSKTTNRFHAYTAGQMRALLQNELGPKFDVMGTGRYLVAFPRGQRNHWAERFEDLYRSFVHYWGVRGIRAKEPEFPLVAIVWPTQGEFLSYARAEGTNIGSNILGYYSPVTNRIALYDVTRGNPDDPNWSMNAETIIHEATHQTAYNTGLHVRFGASPKWVVEGLATMFEAPGVWNSRYNDSQKSRINTGRLEEWKEYVQRRRKPGSLAPFIESDRLFNSDISAAYCQAWALTFYLVETQPRKYADYMKLLAAKPAGEVYPAARRKADFEKAFGDDMAMAEARFLRYMEKVK